MSVAEQRYTVGAEHAGALETVLEVVQGLARKSVHEVEVKRRNASVAQPIDSLDDAVFRLNAADGFLAMGRESLHAEAGTFNADTIDRRSPFARHRARVEFDGHGRIGRSKVEEQRIDQTLEIIRLEGIRAPAAKCDAPDAGRWRKE